MAGAAVEGVRYCNWSLHDVMVHTGRRRDNPQGKYAEVEFRSCHDGGEASAEWYVPEHYPLRVDPALAEEIMARHGRMSRVINGRASGLKSQGPAHEEVEVVGEDGEVTVELRPRAKATPKPAVAADPRTGCRPGTDGHRVGEILLSIKANGFDRKAAIDRVVKELNMDRGLASSWVSTLIKRKPAFKAYGGDNAGK